ncbi:MAG: lytic transglycosylase domain-containing protein [Candidatus Methylomirabilales bacterium]
MRKAAYIFGGLFLVALLPGSATAGGSARVYRHVNGSGVIRYSNIPHPSLSVTPRHSQIPGSLRTMITSAASRYGISARLVEAVIAVESAFNPRAVSPKGAIGLMQLMPKTARRYAVRNPFDPLQNIAGGIRYLRDLLHRFHGDLRLALAAYNAGETAVATYRGIPPYRETREYVKKVLRRYGGPSTMFPRTVGAGYVHRVIGPGGTPHYSNLPPVITLR